MKTLIASLTLLLLASNAWGASPDGIEAHDPWVREAPPNVKVLAAYLQLHNHGDGTRTLVGVESPAFKRVEMHRTEERDGVARMVPATRVMIAAHGMVAFAPGGLHIMLIEPVAALKAGDTVPLVLHFSDGSTLSVKAEVRRDMKGGKAHHHGSPAGMPMNMNDSHQHRH